MNNIQFCFHYSYLDEYKQLINPETHTGQIIAKQGVPGLLRYMNTNQMFFVATTPTTWEGILSLSKDSLLLGKVGHHAFVVLPGDRTCEWCSKKSDIKEFSQIEIRLAKGKILEQLWQKHLALAPKYHCLGNVFDPNKAGYLHYRPFLNDCFVYVNRILKENGLPETQLSRLKFDREKLVKVTSIFNHQLVKSNLLATRSILHHKLVNPAILLTDEKK